MESGATRWKLTLTGTDKAQVVRSKKEIGPLAREKGEKEMKTKKREVITERSVTICVKGQGKENINAAMTKAFDYVLKQLLDADRYYGKKSIGKNKLTWGVEELATFTKSVNDLGQREREGKKVDDTAGMGRQEKAIRSFFEWVFVGMRMPDVELAFECFQETELPASVKSAVTDAINDLMKALIHFRKLDQQAIEKQLKRQTVVDLCKWKTIRTANHGNNVG